MTGNGCSGDDGERRRNAEMRQMFDRLKAVADEAGRIGGERGAEIALQRLFDLTPYDGSDKGQRDELRKTINHADRLRKMCDSFMSIGTKTLFGMLTRVLIVGLLLGLAVLLGVKLQIPGVGE